MREICKSDRHYEGKRNTVICDHAGNNALPRRGFGRFLLQNYHVREVRQVENTASAWWDLTGRVQLVSGILSCFFFFSPGHFYWVSFIKKWATELFSIPWKKRVFFFLTVRTSEQQTLISARGTWFNAGITLDVTGEEASGFLMHLKSPIIVITVK